MDVAVKQDVIVVVDPKNYTLVRANRGDCCESQAYFKAILKTGSTLLFCRRHFLQHESMLKESCEVIYDESAKLLYNRHEGSEN